MEKAQAPAGRRSDADRSRSDRSSTARQVERIHAIVKDTVAAGAKLEAGGTFDGPFYRPTVLTGVKPGMRAFDEEVFGPVAAITSFSTDDEAVALANHSEYGLSAGVFSADVGRAIAVGNRLNTGLLHINDQTVADEPHVPVRRKPGRPATARASAAPPIGRNSPNGSG